MNKLSYKASYYALYTILAIILIVPGLPYPGDDVQGAGVIAGIDPGIWQPANTNALLMLVYGLSGLAIATAAVTAVSRFRTTLKDNPANAIKPLLGLIPLIIVLAIVWAASDGAPMNTPGYDGTDNILFRLKLADMLLYSTYILLFITIVTIIAGSIKKRVS